MKIDTRGLADAHVVTSDVCIIGAGPAGTTLAREFLDSELSVTLLESGGEKSDYKVLKLLSPGTLSGELYEPIESTHLRQVGGTANNWILKMTDDQYGYRYTPFEAIDFEKREAIPHSGWPITKADLDPYYARVQAVCDIGTYEYDATHWARGTLQPITLNPDKAYNSVFLFGPTKKFTQDFPAQIGVSKNVDLYTYATVVELITAADGVTVESALVRTFEGREIHFKAKQFIIAANAYQTPRLLLSSTRHHPNGIGNQHDNVGRYYMDHNLVPCGNFVPHDSKLINQMGFYDMQRVDGASVLGKLVLSPKIVREEGLRNFAAMLFPQPWSQADLDAMNSLAALKLHFMFNYRRFPKGLGKHLMHIYRGRNRLLLAVYEWIRYGVPVLMGLGRGGWSKITNNEKKYGRLELLALIEQTPNPNNRVTLTDEKDVLGCPKIKVHYQFSEDDLKSIVRARTIMGEALEETGLGQYEPSSLPIDSVRSYTGAHHMMGTARMSADPRDGVVDSHCCVHGMANLYVAGSATFVTGSYANPTLTNLALSIRIADRVKERLNAV